MYIKTKKQFKPIKTSKGVDFSGHNWTLFEPFIPQSIFQPALTPVPKVSDPVIKPNTIQFFENQLVGYKEAAQYLDLSESFLRRLKSQGKIPYVSVGKRGIRFKVASLNAWVAEKEVT